MCWRLSSQTFLAGLILGVGIGLVLGIGWGASPHDAMVAAISDLIGTAWITPGVVTLSVAAIYLLIAHSVGFHLSFQIPIAILGISLGVDLGALVVPTSDTFFVIASVFTGALVLKTLSISWLVESHVGGSSLESLIIALSNKLGVTTLRTRLAGEFLFLLIALLLAGPVDLGTYLAAILLPTSITLFRKWAFYGGADRLSITRNDSCVPKSRFEGVRTYLR